MNIRALVIAAVLMVGASFTARSQQFTLVKSVIGSGMTPAAATINGIQFAVDGTIGQPVIGTVSSGMFTIYQGFWTPSGTSGAVNVLPNGDGNGFALEQNYPNPFNPSTTIEYSIATRSKVTIRVMNLLGEEVHAPLVEEVQGEGKYKIDFSDADNLPSGTYIYRMDAAPVDGSAAFSASKRMVLLK